MPGATVESKSHEKLLDPSQFEAAKEECTKESGLEHSQSKATEEKEAKRKRTKDGKSTKGKRPKPASDADADNVPQKKKVRLHSEKPASAKKRDEKRDVMQKAKEKWEKMRMKATDKEKSEKLAADIHGMLKGRLAEFVFRHDGSRIVQWLLLLASKSVKSKVVEELLVFPKGDAATLRSNAPTLDGNAVFLRLLSDRYGSHLAMKLIRLAKPAVRTRILDEVVVPATQDLMRNSKGANMLDGLFSTLLQARARGETVLRVLFADEGAAAHFERVRDAALAKGGAVRGVFQRGLVVLGTEFRGVVVEAVCRAVGRLIERGEQIVELAVVHAAIRELFSVLVGDKTFVTMLREVSTSLTGLIARLAHTKDGVWVAVMVIKLLDAKHRKLVVRGLKGVMRKVATDEFGHRIILGLFAWVDDTRLVGKAIVGELCGTAELDDSGKGDTADAQATPKPGAPKSRGGRSKSAKKGVAADSAGVGNTAVEEGVPETEALASLCVHKHGYRTMVNLLCGRDTRYFNPEGYGWIFEKPDEKLYGVLSKKDEEVRRCELVSYCERGLCAVMREKGGELLSDVQGAAVVVGAAANEGVLRTSAGEVVAELLGSEQGREGVANDGRQRRGVAAVLKVGGTELVAAVRQACGDDGVQYFEQKAGCRLLVERLQSGER